MKFDVWKILGVYVAGLVLIILFTLLTLKCNAQIKKYIVPASLTFVSGMSDGLNQALQFRYSGFKRVFPKARDQWYDPSISWRNKYKDGDPSKGAKFFGSTSFLVGTTDAYHATRTVSNSFNAAAIVFSVTDGKRKWWEYIVEALSYWTINRIGFSLVYNRF